MKFQRSLLKISLSVLMALAISNAALALTVNDSMRSNTDAAMNEKAQMEYKKKLEDLRLQKEKLMMAKEEVKNTTGSVMQNKTQDVERLQKEVQKRKAETLKHVEELKTQRATQMQDTREKLKERMDGAKENTREALGQKKEELKERIQNFRNEGKKRASENLLERMNTLNYNATDRYLRHLNSLEEILNKVEDRSRKLEAEGVDIFSVTAAIERIRNLISSAEEDLARQKETIYPPEITTEEALREVFSAAKETLRNDLEAVHRKIVEIREAIRQTFSTLKSLAVQVEDTASREE